MNIKFRVIKSRWLLGIIVATGLLVGLVFFGFIGIPTKCHMHPNMNDVALCYFIFQAEYWKDREQETWFEYTHIKSYRHDFIIQPAEFLFEKMLIHPQYPADFSDDRVLVGAAHNIFVGRVIEQVGTKERGVGPETQFEVEVFDNIKGNYHGTVVVNQQAGFRDEKLYVVEGDVFTENSNEESLLQIGSVYVFMTRYNEKENWNTLISFPGANRLLRTTESSGDLKRIVENDVRVNDLREIYTREILLEADVRSGNTRNSFISLATSSVDKYEMTDIESLSSTTKNVPLSYEESASSTGATSTSSTLDGSSEQNDNFESDTEVTYDVDSSSTTSAGVSAE